MSEDQTSIQNLFSEFEKPDYETWYEAAVASLKGAPFEKKVITKTYEGFDLMPMYWPSDIEDLQFSRSMPGFAPYVRGTGAAGNLARPWHICQMMDAADPQEFSRAALHDLALGQTMLGMALDGATTRGLDPGEAEPGQVGRGLSLACSQDLEQALEKIDLSQTPVMVNAGAVGLPLLALFAASRYHAKEAPSVLSGCIGADPLGHLAQSGGISMPLGKAYDSLAACTKWAGENAPDLRTILVSISPYHDAGASASQELAFAMATACEYVRAMDERGLPIDQAAVGMVFQFSVGRNFFMEIAKLRAARLLWCKVAQAFGGGEAAQKMHMFARTSAWTKTKYDPYVNMLRNTAEAFAGAMGGVDALSVCPFDEPVRPSGEFSRRVSRNLQVLLQEECHLTQPIDPAGGSYAVEKLTDSLAKTAWEIFQKVEAAGGMAKALAESMPQDAVAETAARKVANLNKRKEVFVGTNMYANLGEVALDIPDFDPGAFMEKRARAVTDCRAKGGQALLSEKLDALAKAFASDGSSALDAAAGAALAGASLGDLAKTISPQGNGGVKVKALDIHRGAEPFEKLRRNMEEFEAKTGSVPKIFLANMGPIPQHKARADFSAGFFQVGGFDVVTNNGFATEEEAAAAAAESGAFATVICSTDKTYPDIVPTLAGLLKEKNPDMAVILAGRPARDLADTWKEAGLDDAIYLGANCFEMLTNLQHKSGVSHE